MTHGKAFHLGAAVAAFGMVLSSTAHAAPTSLGTADPLVSLSLFGTSSSRAAVCAASTAAATGAAAAATTAAAQPAMRPGCVLPVLGNAPPPPVVEAIPPVGVVPVASGGGLGSLLPLAAIAALAALGVWYLESKDDEGPPPLSPF